MTKPMRPFVSFDVHLGLATFQGPGGFTQVYMSHTEANAIALALGVSFEVTNSGSAASQR